MKAVVSPGGEVRSLYRDSVELRDLGSFTITRASVIEPDPSGMWESTLILRIPGPGGLEGRESLGKFRSRGEALEAEARELERRNLKFPWGNSWR